MTGRSLPHSAAACAQVVSLHPSGCCGRHRRPSSGGQDSTGRTWGGPRLPRKARAPGWGRTGAERRRGVLAAGRAYGQPAVWGCSQSEEARASQVTQQTQPSPGWVTCRPSGQGRTGHLDRQHTKMAHSRGRKVFQVHWVSLKKNGGWPCGLRIEWKRYKGTEEAAICNTGATTVVSFPSSLWAPLC